MKQLSIQFNPRQIMVIIGPTASGKSSLAIELARKYNGEIISADSRQIYRGMDIGTGKVIRDTSAGTVPRNYTDSIACHPEFISGSRTNIDTFKNEGMLKQVQHDNIFTSEGISHHLIDICDPNDAYNVTDFKRDVQALIEDIQSRGKLPIICGGTLFWVQSLIDNRSFPEVPPNPKLREELSLLTREALFEKLQTLDPERAKTIDRNNPIRLIRALEIVQALGKVPFLQSNLTVCHPELASGSRANTSVSNNEGMLKQVQRDSRKNYFIIAINPPKDILDEKIKKRLNERFNQGMIEEVKNLHNQGVSFERLEAFGLEYRWIALFLQEKIDEQTMREKLYFDIVHYAKRQRTWLRRFEKQGADIHWIQDASEIDTVLEKK